MTWCQTGTTGWLPARNWRICFQNRTSCDDSVIWSASSPGPNATYHHLIAFTQPRSSLSGLCVQLLVSQRITQHVTGTERHDRDVWKTEGTRRNPQHAYISHVAFRLHKDNDILQTSNMPGPAAESRQRLLIVLPSAAGLNDPSPSSPATSLAARAGEQTPWASCIDCFGWSTIFRSSAPPRCDVGWP